MTVMSIHIPLPLLTPQLLEIAGAIAAVVEKKKYMDMAATYTILEHNLQCYGLVFNIYRIELGKQEGFVKTQKADQKEAKKKKAEIEGSDSIYSFR